MSVEPTERADERPVVLFVCVHNAGRSQMAAAFLEELAGDLVEVRSAGSLPADALNPVAVEAMAEVGIDIAASTPGSSTVTTRAAAWWATVIVAVSFDRATTMIDEKGTCCWFAAASARASSSGRAKLGMMRSIDITVHSGQRLLDREIAVAGDSASPHGATTGRPA